MEAELDLSNYATKSRFKNCNRKILTSIDTSNFCKTVDLASFRSNVVKLGIDKLKNVPTDLNSLKVDKPNVDKAVPVPVDLSKLNDVVKNEVVKKVLYNVKIKNIEYEIPHITNFATNTTPNAKINEVKKEIPITTNLATTTALNAVEKKIPNISNIAKKADHNTKVSESENKISTNHDHDKYITTEEFNNLTSENFTARLKQTNLASKNDIY